MTLLKGISVSIAILYVIIVITSNITPSQLSTNQAYALENKINDAIKKTCPTYESNNDNDIKGAVSNIIKSCIPQSNQPSTPPNPNPDPNPPNTSPFPNNLFSFTASSQTTEPLYIIITDSTSHYSNTYSLTETEVPIEDTIVIPVGDTYTIKATDYEGNVWSDTTFESNNCKTGTFGEFEYICTGIMGTEPQHVSMTMTN
jgi:hypothetical protein